MKRELESDTLDGLLSASAYVEEHLVLLCSHALHEGTRKAAWRCVEALRLARERAQAELVPVDDIKALDGGWR